MYDWGEKRKSIQNALKSGLYVLGTFKVDHLQPVDPILFHKFSLFFTFMLGANSYYPRESNAENGKIECDKGFQCLGHTYWTICSLLIQFCSTNFPTFSLLCWGQFLLPQKEEGRKLENRVLPNCGRQRGFSAWGVYPRSST